MHYVELYYIYHHLGLLRADKSFRHIFINFFQLLDHVDMMSSLEVKIEFCIVPKVPSFI
jgi:hypothetical protein